MTATKAQVLTRILQVEFGLQIDAACFGIANDFASMTFPQAWSSITSVTPPGRFLTPDQWEDSCRAALIASGKTSVTFGNTNQPSYSYESTYLNISGAQPDGVPTPVQIRTLWSSAVGLPSLAACQAFETEYQTLLDFQQNARNVTDEILSGALTPGATAELTMLLFAIRALAKAVQAAALNRAFASHTDYNPMKQMTTWLNNQNVSDV